jgi:hypothetical protein
MQAKADFTRQILPVRRFADAKSRGKQAVANGTPSATG